MTGVTRLRPVLSAFALVAMASLALPVPPASAGHGNGPKFTAWPDPDNSITYDPQGNYCFINARVGMQEFNQHGVEYFKWRIRAYDSENYVAQDFLAGIIHTWGWYYSSAFPDDTGSYVWHVAPPGRPWLRVAATRAGLKPSAVIRVKAVGVRPSFWKPDFKAWVTIGTCSYTEAMYGETRN